MNASGKESVVVLLSGGLDSAVCLWLAKEANWHVYTLSFNYHNRLKREIESSAKLAQNAGVVEHKVIELPFLFELEDLKTKNGLPYRNFPSAYIPARNMVFYAIAVSYAESISAKYVIGGHNNLDHKSFPDSTQEFFARLNEIIKIGTLTNSTEIITPLSKLDKLRILKEAIRLKVPLELTWSCYDREDIACGRCPACRIRLQTFSRAKIKDLIPYAEETISKSI
ncbi:MAG: 7-cyano-7-deazaguanine synthase QueC [Thaumarchaeota archaeon]|nr:7-cyano-7-deazaguanine synthase QueC [Nitrososphaerota archaeon]